MSASGWLGRAAALLLGALALAPASAEMERAALVQLGASVMKVEVQREQGGFGVGSGVVVDRERVVTNCHVTRDAVRISVMRGEGRWPVQSQVADTQHDLCLLRVPGLAMQPAALGQVSALRLRESLTALGYTGGGAMQVSPGDLVALHRLDGSAVIQSSNFFNSGASGGGLFNDAGELVGILTFRLRGAAAHYFAAPVEWVRALLAEPGLGEVVAPLASRPLAYWQQPPGSQPGFLQGAVLEQEQRWGELAALAERWSERDAGDAEAWYLRGLALAQLERLPAAREALERSVQIESASSAAWFRLGEVCVRLKQIDRARLAAVRLAALDAPLADELNRLIEQEQKKA